MSEEISLITTERRHLFEISQVLCKAIPYEFLQDPLEPVIVSVRGTYRDGKKIIPDAAVEGMLGVVDARRPQDCDERVFFDGNVNYDEYWTGWYGKTNLQITFINAVLCSGYSNERILTPDLRTSYDVAKNFIPLRKKGGITFIHNDDDLAEKKAWIDIWIEKDGGGIVGVNYSRLVEDRDVLRCRFNSLASAKPWTRYLNVTIRKLELLASQEFMAVFDSLKRPDSVFESNARPLVRAP